MGIQKITAVVLVLFLSVNTYTQQSIGLREVINYEKQSYNAGSQNWAIRQDIQGRLYFANNEGLLSFDGTYWKLYPLPNKTIARSIEFGKDNRIYIGGQDEIGYFGPGKNGKLAYHSLKELIPVADRKFEDIWNIVSYGDAIFFRSNNKIFQYENDTIRVFRPASSWYFIGLYNDQLIAQEASKGLLVYANGNWNPFIDYNKLPPDFYITSTTALDNDTCLLTTQRTGLYLLAGNQLNSLPLSSTTFNPNQFISGAVKVDEESFIIGTYANGFYLVNNQGAVLENFAGKEGLQNNNVRSLFIDRNRNIWLGLESGIDFVAFNNAIKHINPPVLNDGAGYSVAIYENNLYAGLSNGIYRLPLPDIKDLSYAKSKFTFLPGSEGQTWGLSVVNNQLLAGRHEGFYQVKEDKMTPVLEGNGYWTFQSLQNLQQSSLVIAGNYTGVRLFDTDGNRFSPREIVPHFSESARFLQVDNNSNIWVSHPYRGIYKIQLTGNGDARVKLYTDSNGLPSALNNHVYNVKNRIVIATEKGIYEYNDLADTFEPSRYFREIFGNQGIRYLKEDPNGNIWFIQEKSIGVADFSTLQPTIIYLPELNSKMVSGFEHIYPVNQHNIFVGGEKGIYHINYEKYKQNRHPLNVYIRTVNAIGKNDSLLFGGYFGNANDNEIQPKNLVPSVSHQWNSFHITYSAPLFEQQPNIEYSYWLEGFDKDWSEWSKKTEKDYTNLTAGKYIFKVKARNNLGNESTENSYAFTVLPPWYQTTLAYIAYISLLVYIAYLLYRKHKKKILSERLKHQEEQKRQAYLHQLELEKAEKEVMRLRNEKLETEIEFKNSELASTAMHLVQKEEFLLKIKDELQHLNKNGKESADPGELKKILRILSEEEKLNSEWEQFAVHFNKVHSNFLIMLKEKYPNLKAHELKLCAYLRMNLSSKEIAQLMSISVRGVEISRYRLRKKLEIPTEVNLFQFLFDLQKNNVQP